MDYIISATDSATAASLMVEVGLLHPNEDGSTPPMPPYLQGKAPDGTAYFAAIVGPINGSGCYGRLRWAGASVPQFPPGLTVYVPSADPTTGAVTWIPALPDGVEAQIPVIG